VLGGNKLFPFCQSHLFNRTKFELKAVPTRVILVWVFEILKMPAVYAEPKEPCLVFQRLSTDPVLPTISVVNSFVAEIFDKRFVFVQKHTRSLAGGTEFGRHNDFPIGFKYTDLKIVFRVDEVSEYEVKTDEIEVVVVKRIVPYISGKCAVSKIGCVGVTF